MIPAGLTCVDCQKPLYPDNALITSDGFRHVRCPLACAVEGCETPRGNSGARGWCNVHYKRWKRTGNPIGSNSIELEDVEWMAETGESFEGAAMRLNVSPSSLERFLDRHKRRDVMAKFRRPGVAA